MKAQPEEGAVTLPVAAPGSGVWRRTPSAPPAEPAVDAVSLYAAHRLKLVRLAVLLVDDRASAEDVVQDAFASFLSAAPRLRDSNAAIGYLHRSVVNGCHSMLRRRKTARAYHPPHQPDCPGPEGEVIVSEEHREMFAALGHLAPRQREVLVLRYWSELSEAEIADTLGISRGSVKSTASRALRQLATQINLLQEAPR